MDRESIIHLFAGGAGGTVAAVITCPLEVLKTRLQSSVATFGHNAVQNVSLKSATHAQFVNISTCSNVETYSTSNKGRVSLGIYSCLRYIVQTEGGKALFKGLGPNLVGVTPSRSIYFFIYGNTKPFLNKHLNPDTALVHMCSAIFGGLVVCTITNPVWFVKTRLQLDQKRESKLKFRDCAREVYHRNGLMGFYKGISASYFGITETVIYFVIYENLKEKLTRDHYINDDKSFVKHFLKILLASSITKPIASTIAYPHEVVRTRLREEGNKYKSFLQTLKLVIREEGTKGLYRGLATHIVRQIPNNAIMMGIYEAIVYCLSKN